jgi:hypothetical protein
MSCLSFCCSEISRARLPSPLKPTVGWPGAEGEEVGWKTSQTPLAQFGLNAIDLRWTLRDIAAKRAWMINKKPLAQLIDLGLVETATLTPKRSPSGTMLKSPGLRRFITKHFEPGGRWLYSQRPLPAMLRKRSAASLSALSIPAAQRRPPGRGPARNGCMRSNAMDSGPTVFEHAYRLGLEGIVSKRLDAPHRSGPVKTWLKSNNPPQRSGAAGNRRGLEIVAWSTRFRN